MAEKSAAKKSDIKFKVKRYLIFPLITLLILFFFAEALLTILEPYLFQGFYQYDPELGFKVRAFERNTNSFGFNDLEYPLEKDPGTYRIVILSDSFNWSLGPTKNYVKLIEYKFEQYYTEKPVEVINVGYPMTHSADQLKILEKYGLLYQPDLVLLGFFVGNDFVDAMPNRKRIVVNGLFFDIHKDHELILFGYPIVPKSRLITFIQQKFKILTSIQDAQQMNADQARQVERREKSGDGAQKGIVPLPPKIRKQLATQTLTIKSTENEQATFVRERYLEILNSKLAFCNLKSHEAGAFDDRIKMIFDSISKMQELLESKEIEFMVAVYPDEFQLDENLLNEVIDTHDLNRDDLDVEFMQKILKSHLEERGIPYIDLLPGFRTRFETYRLYKLRDTHWNENGNILAADLIFPELLKVVSSN